MPKILLDIGQLNEPVIWLLETDGNALESYAIASYAWGSGSQGDAIVRAKTTKENMNVRKASGMELVSLPKTLQDLVEVTQRIGHRYLWLDAFCIVQNDRIYKSRQLNSMVEFYKQADVLVSAASASNCDKGFLQSRSGEQCYGTISQLPYKCKLDNHETQGS
ncbi:heterokaryon incompatibility protein-domain-containing protein [Fusarium oxysporum]|nr:heterokaryon incompatibility protein-domain-containing protein [Fusarium oxysporum]